MFEKITDESAIEGDNPPNNSPEGGPVNSNFTDSLSYGINVVKNVSCYATDKIYNYNWKENIETFIQTAIPRPKDPRLEFIMSYPNIEDRLKISAGLNRKYPDYIPIILERDKMSFLQPLKKKKFIVPNHFKFGDLSFSVRQCIPHLNSYDALLFTILKYDASGKVTKTVPAIAMDSSVGISEFFAKYRSADNFLYMSVREENVFG
jgi:hypothetical protein